MYFEFNEDQEEFRGSLRKLLSERAPLTRVRQVAETRGYDSSTWQLLASDMGVPGIHVPEELGGSGFSLLETCVVVQELGRALTPVPVITTIGAMEAIRGLGSAAQQEELVPGLASGETIGTLALSSNRDLEVDGAAVRASAEGDTHTLTGRVDYVAFGHTADLLVVPAVTPSGNEIGLYVVAATASGVTIESRETLDLTRPLASVQLAGAPARLLGSDHAAIVRVVDLVRILLANEAIGSSKAILDMAVDYAKQRVQFNRPIGSFQAIKHKCADMAIAIDSAEATVMFASMSAAGESKDFRLAALMAKAQGSECLTLCASQNIQVHGGIGFTWEADPHLYFRRAKSIEPLFGSKVHHNDMLADLVGI
ncbi:acyl-CoA/acyl-ACP dehydrogenase [Rhodococcus sp. HNM0563]|uniref:acyl-CoA dehydrogenase family protein n=1 Tax=unclassified Rhodococcus (in: high G+C Gram-positive bacteria) TaxID=192944 RepID=UPI00146BCEBC|nr:acyl-CoA dehydrogenase family protein [Rhodococcus sp. F64268]MCK0090706.1 acyl-CoA/acyl-ACP dehydrogenase [Rhodococcus sp. F64268]NLU61900.1 acyl-CoA/acyl-ACP dehydrogenase [Rhodococcus sp. HNM0563]